ncbi:murein biosynthesis integral membrane protein MurJ [Streptomyces sp. BR123]|uniref:murein biosynthesis integral membrane protein MurJ n=1 Tax=Streptomyces sp. BR123 TaxID=2749828 RepID=UPI0015C463B5|nr:murein biosynthesis integral membrane protein MurJ [Streptomyces sp. BR123]NXY92875.1 murein biosynthesis integral membrane protein MurJ [Streptomyces sp. BR123]
MNAPYDGDRAQGTGAPAPSSGADPGMRLPGQVPVPGPAADRDPYVQDVYDRDPYRSQDLSAQDPVAEVLYDRASHPPPPPGTYQDPGPLYGAPRTAQQGPDPRVWAQTPPPEPDGPSRHLPYGDRPSTTQFVGVDSLVTSATEEEAEPDAFAHLYKDQQAAPGAPAEDAPVASPAPSKPTGRAAGLLKSSALMAAGTIVSRITGFLRTLVVAAAIGVGTFNDTYQIANTLPTMIYVLVGGGALNAVFIPQLVRAMKNDDDGGEAYANRLLTLVVVLLAAVTTICVLAAPVFITMMSPKIASDPQQMEVAVAFARYCLPTMFFMGVHVVLGQILNARGRFGAMMWTPVLNNIVAIATFGAFIWAFGGFTTSGVSAATVTPEGVRLLGIGTLLGLTVQALAMLPYLRDAGFSPRLRFDWKGHGLGKAAGLAKWTFFFVLANQIGLVVVTQLATWAGAIAEEQGHPGTGITGYQYALLLWQMPQAIITVSVMTAVLPRISRSAHDGDAAAVRDDISYGLRTSAVAIVPCAFAFLALGVPMATLLYAGAGAGAQNIGYILMAFGLGLIPYSVQYVVLRGFYAYEDTRTPFYNTVIVAAVNASVSAAAFFVLPARWAVVGMAGAYGLGYAVGVGVAWKRLRKRLGGDLDGAHVRRTYTRLIGACIPAAAVAGGVAYAVTQWLGSGVLGSLTAVVVGSLALGGVFLLAAKRMRIEELNAMVGMVRGRMGR